MRRIVPALVLCVAATPLLLHAQQGSRPFGIEDALAVSTYALGDLSEDGRWLAATSAVRRDGAGVDFRRDGDPSYIRPQRQRVWVIDTETGRQTAVFQDLRQVRALSWSPDGTRLAMLLLEGDRFVPAVWERQGARLTRFAVPAGQYVAETSDLRWTRDGRTLVFQVRPESWRRETQATFARMTGGPVFVQSSDEPFLSWDALRRSANRGAIVALDLATRRTRELLPESALTSWQLVAGDSVVAWTEDVTKKTDYDVIFGTETRLIVRDANGSRSRVVLPSLKNTALAWSPETGTFAWGREGRVHLGNVRDTVTRQIAGPAPGARDTAAADTSAEARERRARERFTPLRFSPAGDALLLSNRQGFWIHDVAAGSRELVLATDDSSRTTPRHAVVAWSGDGRHVYFSRASRTAWERGFVRYDRQAKRLEELVKDGRLFSGLRVAKRADRVVLAIGDGNRPADLWAANGALTSPVRLTDANPWLRERALGRTELLTYRDADGETKYGVVLYPPGFQPGSKAPTVFNIYEEFFDDTFDATANVLASAGYVVVKPSVDFDIGYPGEAWLKGVTAAANSLIERGVADSARLGVFGTSYGGYATNLLITQTQRFRAAINISGKVDFISFYTDSPRLGVRNVHAAEKSQDRIGATLWQQPQKYVAHSAIMFADRITTPLLLITGELDSNVPAGNTSEMYYALRRLGKKVTWVNYMNGGHGAPLSSVEDLTDYHRRIVEWFDEHLKAPAKGGKIAEATSLLGEPLVPPAPGASARAGLEARLAAAEAAWKRTPANADSIIWYGRRLAYVGRYRDAIRVFGDGMAANPRDARLYRHRGHRWLTVREIDKAVADFERAATLVQGKADEVEPDGAPNARNIPTSTLQTNIYYHLGLAHYLRGDFEHALAAYRECMTRSKNPDMQVATAHWLYMTLRRLGRDQEAAAVLSPIRRDMDIIENGAYHRLLLLYKGELAADSLVPPGGSGLEDVTTGYGLANWHLYNGRRAEAERVLARILSVRSQWPAFGYLAAEAEAKRLGLRAPEATAP
jgi:dipeptidyl aminopeptidase/acylaminoacyl peptidase/tetratricopeptide (TPR) repeat protein